jgi:hypothetical protein
VKSEREGEDNRRFLRSRQHLRFRVRMMLALLIRNARQASGCWTELRRDSCRIPKLLSQQGFGNFGAYVGLEFSSPEGTLRKCLSVLLLSIFVLVLQSYANAPSIPALVLQARYVALGYETAEGFIAETDFRSFASTKVMPDDRQAIANIYDALNKWKRYTIVINPGNADMLIAVRTGRLASGTGGIRVGTGGIDPTTGRRTSSTIGTVFGAEAGPPDDYLAVYQADDGREAARLWVATQHDGLVGKNPPLFKNFKDEVEAAAKKSKKP